MVGAWLELGRARAAALTHAEGRPADDLCLIAARLVADEAAHGQAA
jgi:hypothetical protein